MSSKQAKVWVLCPCWSASGIPNSNVASSWTSMPVVFGSSSMNDFAAPLIFAHLSITWPRSSIHGNAKRSQARVLGHNLQLKPNPNHKIPQA